MTQSGAVLQVVRFEIWKTLINPLDYIPLWASPQSVLPLFLKSKNHPKWVSNYEIVLDPQIILPYLASRYGSLCSYFQTISGKRIRQH